MTRTEHCQQCGTDLPIADLDAKPARLAGRRNRGNALRQALDRNEDCDRLECQVCYGRGWQKGPT